MLLVYLFFKTILHIIFCLFEPYTVCNYFSFTCPLGSCVSIKCGTSTVGSRLTSCSCLRYIAHLNSPLCSVSSPSVFGHFKGQTWLEHIAPCETDGVHLQAACHESYQPPQQQSEDGSSEGSRPAPTGSLLLHINLHHVLPDTFGICRTGRTRVQFKDVEKQQPVFTLHFFSILI